MSYESPNVILYDISGNVLAVQNATAIPASTPALMIAGSDGTNSRYILVDSSSRQIVAGAGVAGTPAGGVLTIQGITSGTPVIVSGTVTNASVSTTGSAIPASATFIGGSVTTAAPTYTTGNLGALSLTTTGLLRIDGSGVTQPVSGTVTVTQATAANLRAQTSSESNTGASPPTQAIYTGGSVTTAAPTYTTGQMNALSLTTTGLLRIDGSGVTQPVSGTVTANQGTPNTNTNAWFARLTDGTNNTVVKPASTAALATDPALVVTISPNNAITANTSQADTTGSGTLNALNAVASVAMAGQVGAGIHLSAGTLIGTIVPEISFDGGTSWDITQFDDPTTGNKTSSIVFSSSNAATSRSIVSAAGASNARVRVSAFTSGTASCTIRATQAGDPSVLFSGSSGSLPPPTVAQVGGNDGANLRPLAVDTSGDVGVAAYMMSNYVPTTTNVEGSLSGILQDAGGNLQIRGPVITDEGSFRDDFTGSSLFTNITGTVTFTNGSTIVTGSGTSFTTQVTTDYSIRKSTDANTAFAWVESVISDTQLVLGTAYTGASGSGTGTISYWRPTIAATGTITVASSLGNLNQGTANADVTMIQRDGDYLPLIMYYVGSITQRIANQVAVVGFQDVPGTPGQAAYIQFDGTDNTKVKFVTQFSSAAADIQTTTVTLPSSAVTSSSNAYEIDLTAEQAALVVNGTVLATHRIHLPQPYTLLNPTAYLKNSAAVTATTLATDSIFIQNLDTIQSGNVFQGEPDPVQIYGKNPSGGFSNVQVDSSGNLQVVLNTVAAGADAQITYGDVALSSIVLSPVRRTTYTEPSANFQGSIVSSSANDAAAGTGARTVRIWWMDVTGVTVGSEDVTLNGTTNVNLVTTTKCYIEKMEVLTVGSTGSNVGTITLRTGLAGGGNVVGTIGATDNKTFWAHHYVQTSKICSINGIIGGSTATTVGGGSSFFIKSIPVGATNQVEKQVSDTISLYGQANQVVRNYTTAIPVSTGPARMILYVLTTSSTSITYRGSFDYIDN